MVASFGSKFLNYENYLIKIEEKIHLESKGQDTQLVPKKGGGERNGIVYMDFFSKMPCGSFGFVKNYFSEFKKSYVTM